MKKRTKYQLLDGQLVPGVTTILGMISKPQLYAWYAKNGQDSFRILEESGEFGSTVHSLIEAVVSGQKPHLNAKNKTILDNFQVWADKNVKEYLWFEKQVLSEKYKYGGTADFAFINKAGKRVLADVKTSSGIWPEMHVQLAAYEQALEEMGEKFDELIILHLDKETLVWEEQFVITDGLFDVFLAAYKLWMWRSGKD